MGYSDRTMVSILIFSCLTNSAFCSEVFMMEKNLKLVKVADSDNDVKKKLAMRGQHTL